jgi:ATP-binding cassette subfamily C protein
LNNYFDEKNSFNMKQNQRHLTKENVYFVEEGEVNIYLSDINNKQCDRLYYLITIKKGSVFFGNSTIIDGKEVSFVAIAQEETKIALRSINSFYENNKEELEKYYQKYSHSFKDIVGYQDLENKSIEDANEELMKAVLEWRRNKTQSEEEILKVQSEDREKEINKNLLLIYRLFHKEEVTISTSTGNNLYDAIKKICDDSSINIVDFDKLSKIMDGRTIDIEGISRLSKFSYRDVLLEKDWHKKDNGPLLGFDKDDNPISIIPISPSKYRVYDFKNDKIYELTEEIANTISPKAYMFYRPFPNKVMNIKDILSFGLERIWKRDGITLLSTAFIATLIGLFIPYLNEKIFDAYIPDGERGLLIQMGLLIATFMIGNLFINVVKFFTLFRTSNRMEYSIQAAVYDRIMNMPMSFYGEYDTGQIVSRGMGITTIFNVLANTVVTGILNAIFSLVFLWRMYKYSSKLANWGLLLTIAVMAVILLLGMMQIKYEKKLVKVNNKISGLLFQLINGMAKLRIAGKEEKAIYLWNREFIKGRALVWKKEAFTNLSSTFIMIMQTMFTVLFYYIMFKKDIGIELGQFLGFSAAFGAFFAAMGGVIQIALTCNNLIPLYEMAKPILETVTEYKEEEEILDAIQGEIELSHVDFKYDKEGDFILKDINIKIEKGQYVALVGPSGCGKSTLLKLLLGFEEPLKGSIFYDNKNIDNIDKRELRKKLGVVLQNGQLISGSIAENITIADPDISQTRLKEVIKEAGLESDIKGMPMGIHTVIQEGAGTISGGQKQRILVARAIVNKPNVIYFDEATSALDNATQTIVTNSLEAIEGTKIVIAHRLSTIINCDKIFVMDKGRVIEQGNYEELMKEEGIFYKLASRQLA